MCEEQPERPIGKQLTEFSRKSTVQDTLGDFTE